MRWCIPVIPSERDKAVLLSPSPYSDRRVSEPRASEPPSLQPSRRLARLPFLLPRLCQHDPTKEQADADSGSEQEEDGQADGPFARGEEGV